MSWLSHSLSNQSFQIKYSFNIKILMQTHCFCNINFLWHFQANAYIINFISHRRSLSLPFPSFSIILILGQEGTWREGGAAWWRGSKVDNLTSSIPFLPSHTSSPPLDQDIEGCHYISRLQNESFIHSAIPVGKTVNASVTRAHYRN